MVFLNDFGIDAPVVNFFTVSKLNSTVTINETPALHLRSRFYFFITSKNAFTFFYLMVKTNNFFAMTSKTNKLYFLLVNDSCVFYPFFLILIYLQKAKNNNGHNRNPKKTKCN